MSDDLLRARVTEMEEALLRILRNRRDGRVPLSSHHDELDGIAAGINVLLDDLRHELGQTQRQLQHAQKMEAIGRLAGGIAHDFNNLLQVILAHAAFLGERPLDDEARSDITQIELAATRARDLTRQLLSFARRQPAEIESIDLNAVVERASTMLRPVLGASIELVFERDGELWPVHGDATPLEQIVVNLIVNARDAMPQGGRVTVRTRRLPASAERPDGVHVVGDAVVLSVEDNGDGLTPDVMAKMFEPFFTTKPRGFGTGLGLAVCLGIAAQHGGELVASSPPGRGAVLTLVLPRGGAARPADDAGRAPTVAPAGGTETILIVDDQVAVRRLLERSLTRYGYRILSAGDGEEALGLFTARRAEVALVLSDLDMPRLSGAALIEQLIALGAKVPFIVVSGLTSHAPAIDGARISILPKPFAPDALARAVRAALDA